MKGTKFKAGTVLEAYFDLKRKLALTDEEVKVLKKNERRLKMNKKEFEQFVKSTGANKCTCFNWSYTKKSSCMREYIASFAPFTPCIMLKGEKCPYYREGI